MSPISSNRYAEAIFAIGIIKNVTGEKRQGEVVSTPPPGRPRVNQPTCYCISVRGSILDIILSDNHLLVDIVEHHPPLGTSDHSMVEFRMFFPEGGPTQSHLRAAPDHITLPVYDLNAGNYSTINATIDNTDWNILFGYSFDSYSLWSEFKTIVWAIIDAFVPKKSCYPFC